MSGSHSVDCLGDERSGGSRLPLWVRLISTLSTILVVPSGVICIALMLHVIADVIGRTVFHHPLPGTLEITSNWWMVSLVFLAFGYAQMRGEHIRATMLTDLLSPAWRRGAEIGAMVIVCALATAMAYFGWTVAVASHGIREAVNGGIAVWPSRFVVPIGCAALMLQCVATIYEIAVDAERESHAGELI